MTNIIDFSKARSSLIKKRSDALKASAKKKTLCDNKHHKWRIYTAQRFDVKEGKLLTIYRCEHCGTDKTELH